MKRANQKTKRQSEDMRAEYNFDYSKARPNRCASRMRDRAVAVVLDPDVAKVFNSSESVNRLLRSVISAVPKR
jgi:hypothetical protein